MTDLSRPERTVAELRLDHAIGALESARRESDDVLSVRHSREAAAFGYAAVIALHGEEASAREPLTKLIDRAEQFEELDPCAADAAEIEEHVATMAYEHARADSQLLANAVVTWAQDVFAHPRTNGSEPRE